MIDAASNNGRGWSFEIDNSGANGLQLATYVGLVPEPSTVGLIAIASCIIAATRRKVRRA